jgi:hypothetical protein
MHTKTKNFLEDIGIVLIVTALIYGVYSVYTYYSNNTGANYITEEKKVESPKIIPEKIILKKEEVIEEIKIESKEKIIEPIIPMVKLDTDLENKVEYPEMLKTFLNDLESKIINNFVFPDDLNSTISGNEVKIRITVLKEGGSEQLTLMEGDENLFTINQENILKIFPLVIDDKIKDNFPRYVRITIK